MPATARISESIFSSSSIFCSTETVEGIDFAGGSPFGVDGRFRRQAHIFLLHASRRARQPQRHCRRGLNAGGADKSSEAANPKPHRRSTRTLIPTIPYPTRCPPCRFLVLSRPAPLRNDPHIGITGAPHRGDIQGPGGDVFHKEVSNLPRSLKSGRAPLRRVPPPHPAPFSPPAILSTVRATWSTVQSVRPVRLRFFRIVMDFHEDSVAPAATAAGVQAQG